MSFLIFSSAKNLKDFKGKTDLICASNVICHVPDLNNLITAVDHLLKKKWNFGF